MLKTSLMAVAAGFLFVANHADAAPRDVEAFLQHAAQEASAEVAQAGVDLTGQPIAIKARVGSDGRLTSARVVRSSGSLETDQKAAQALRRFRTAAPPLALIGSEVTLTVGGAPIVQAKAP